VADWIVHFEATQFTMAAANHNALSADEMRSDVVR